jgi:hypothetical protein
MSKYEIKPKLSKDYVLSQLTQEQIFEHYLRIPVREGLLICNPTRIDNSPTANFYTLDNVLWFHDHSGKGFAHGDCFNLVQYLHGGTFMEAMARIMRDLRGEERPEHIKSMPSIFKAESKETLIQVRVRNWREEDKAFWQPYFIRIPDLEKYWVDPVEYAWINEELRYIYDKDDRCYSYYFGESRRKLYFPDRAIMRFRQNSQAVQGFRQLPSTGDLCIITKSLKDVIQLDRLGYSAVALQSENSLYTQALHRELSGRFRQLLVFYDNDETGRDFASKIYEEYEVPPIEIPKHSGYKDISDYVKGEKSLEKGKELIQTLIKDTL